MGTPKQTPNYRDDWFTKPLLFKSDTGRWLCTTTRSDEWRATGNGVTPLEAFEDMKRIIVAAYRPNRAEFA